MIPSIADGLCFRHAPQKLEAIAAAGFTAVEIFENDLIAFPALRWRQRSSCADLGLGDRIPPAFP